MTKAHRLATRKPKLPVNTLPLNFLLGCSQASLQNFELARLAEIADLRCELTAIVDRMVEQLSQAALARWFKEQDRQSLKHAIDNEESAEEWAKRMIRDGQRNKEELVAGPMPSPWIIRPSLPPGVAHLAAAARYKERNVAQGKCSLCPKPLDSNSVRYCAKHLAMQRERERQKRHKKGLRSDPRLDPGTREYLYGEGKVTESTHGRTPGTLASLEMNREKKTRALLAELGIRPESAAVSLKAAMEALQKCMPRSRADALTQAELFSKAGIVTKTTGQKALAKLAGQIQRKGKGIRGNPFRYYEKRAEQ